MSPQPLAVVRFSPQGLMLLARGWGIEIGSLEPFVRWWQFWRWHKARRIQRDYAAARDTMMRAVRPDPLERANAANREWGFEQ